MMKRTKKHCKQNLEHLADVIIRGESTPGLIDQITDFFKQHNISVSAFRLKFLDKDEHEHQNLLCYLYMYSKDQLMNLHLD